MRACVRAWLYVQLLLPQHRIVWQLVGLVWSVAHHKITVSLKSDFLSSTLCELTWREQLPSGLCWSWNHILWGLECIASVAWRNVIPMSLRIVVATSWWVYLSHRFPLWISNQPSLGCFVRQIRRQHSLIRYVHNHFAAFWPKKKPKYTKFWLEQINDPSKPTWPEQLLPRLV